MFWGLLIVIGLIVFSISAGNYIYIAKFKKSNYEKNSFVKNEAHVKDEKIMTPLLTAKQRWITNKEIRNITTVKIKGFCKKYLNILTVRKAPILKGEIWEPENIRNSKTSRTEKAVILVHGFSDSSSGMAYLAEEYHKQNYIVLVINLRSHGESTGEYPGLGYLDAKDLLLWIEYLNKRYTFKIQITLHGVSMGGGTVIQTLFSSALWNNDSNIQGAVADCSFACFKDQTKLQISKIIGNSVFQKIVGECIYWGTSFSCFIHTGFFIGKSCPIKKIKTISCKKFSDDNKIRIKEHKKPFLILFQGLSDMLVIPENADKIYETLEKKNITKNILIKVPDAPHIGSYFYEPEEYMKIIFKESN